jgi:hypothetical protein
LGHQINNCPYQSSIILLAHIMLMDHRLYMVSLPIQNPILNIHILIYPLALLNVACR